MSRIAPQPEIASVYVVCFGRYGNVSRYARQRGVCRQWIYREAMQFQRRSQEQSQQLEQAQQQVAQLRREVADLRRQLARAVVLDDDKQAAFASVGQARGVSLPDCRELLEVLIPGRSLSVATLGRRTKAAGEQAGRLLPVLDEWAQQHVRDAMADEIYVKKPVLMMVEPESLCWLAGRLSDEASGAAWAKEFQAWPQLEQVMRDGGSGLAKGVELVNAARREQGRSPMTDQGDHYHATRGAGVGLGRAQQQAQQALDAAEKAEKALAQCRRRGTKQTGHATKASQAWAWAERAMDLWSEREQHWQRAKAALCLFTPEGELNSRARAEAELTEALAQLPDKDFAKTKQQMQKPEMLNYLDRVHSQLQALPYEEEIKQAAVRQEGLRRQPELLRGENPQAAARRGVLLMCAVVLAGAKEKGQEAVAAVQQILRRAYRASSLVECINSVLRMQQARHRKMTQGLLDLKRLYWNSHTFRTGRRRKTTPYQRLGVPWPDGMSLWDVLKLTPEQLRNKLCITKRAS